MKSILNFSIRRFAWIILFLIAAIFFQNCNSEKFKFKLPGGKSSDTSPSQPTETLMSSQNDPLYVFYVIHVHGPGGVRGEVSEISQEEFNGTLTAIRSIADKLEKYKAKGTFEFLQLVVDGAIKYQGSDNILTELVSRGHEVGAHSHTGSNSLQQWQKTRERILAAGVREVTTMGSRCTDVENDSGAKIAKQAGYSILTDNLSPIDSKTFSFIKSCSDWGIGDNNYYSKTWSFIHPWVPDTINGNFCKHNSKAELVYIDHITGDWLKFNKKAFLTSESFENMKSKFEAALNVQSTSQIKIWGLVSHEIEYQKEGATTDTTKPINQESIAALGDFLSYMNKFSEKFRWATAREIAEEFRKKGI